MNDLTACYGVSFCGLLESMSDGELLHNQLHYQRRPASCIWLTVTASAISASPSLPTSLPASSTLAVSRRAFLGETDLHIGFKTSSHVTILRVAAAKKERTLIKHQKHRTDQSKQREASYGYYLIAGCWSDVNYSYSLIHLADIFHLSSPELTPAHTRTHSPRSQRQLSTTS